MIPEKPRINYEQVGRNARGILLDDYFINYDGIKLDFDNEQEFVRLKGFVNPREYKHLFMPRGSDQLLVEFNYSKINAVLMFTGLGFGVNYTFVKGSAVHLEGLFINDQSFDEARLKELIESASEQELNHLWGLTILISKTRRLAELIANSIEEYTP